MPIFLIENKFFMLSHNRIFQIIKRKIKRISNPLPPIFLVCIFELHYRPVPGLLALMKKANDDIEKLPIKKDVFGIERNVC